jgi:hypothetical protein
MRPRKEDGSELEQSSSAKAVSGVMEDKESGNLMLWIYSFSLLLLHKEGRYRE